jgi:hypothetical protein
MPDLVNAGSGHRQSKIQETHPCKERKPEAPGFKFERVGHTERLTQFPSVDVLEWYHSDVLVRQWKSAKGPATRRHLLVALY